MASISRTGASDPIDGQSTRPSRPHACVLCQQRKVKCDRQDPCAGCVRFEVNCIYRAPPPPRRRKRRSPEDILVTRLKKYEQILNKLGVDVKTIGDEAVAASCSSNGAGEDVVEKEESGGSDGDGLSANEELERRLGRLIINNGKTQFLDNPLWMNLSDEIINPEAILEDRLHSNQYDVLINEDRTKPDMGQVNGALSAQPMITSLQSMHPEPIQIIRLWQIFLDNVDPVTKLCHTPTVQQQILDATVNLDNIPAPLEALMFSIYNCAVASLSEEECLRFFEEPKKSLIHRYHLACKHALFKCEFMVTSDLTVLRAVVLYFLAMRGTMAASGLWVMTGLSLRIAQRMGLHRDGTNFGLSAFETEMRRRIWWQIVLFDGFCAELSGAGKSISGYTFDTKVPLNVNDNELTPTMLHAPKEHVGITEMSFVLLRCEMGNIIRKYTNNQVGFDNFWGWVNHDNGKVEEKMTHIQSFKELIEVRFLRGVDRSIPFHNFLWIIGRSILNVLMIRTRSIFKYEEGTTSPESREMVLKGALDTIEDYRMLFTDPELHRFRWHVHAHFHWHAFMALLHQLQRCTEGELADRAWSVAEFVFEQREDLLTNPKFPLHAGVNNLALKAWEARRGAIARLNEKVEAPQFIRHLQLMRATGGTQAKREDLLPPNYVQRPPDLVPTFDSSITGGYVPEPIPWNTMELGNSFSFNYMAEPFEEECYTSGPPLGPPPGPPPVSYWGHQ